MTWTVCQQSRELGLLEETGALAEHRKDVERHVREMEDAADWPPT